MATKKAHAIEKRWTTGMFQPERYILCRCGARFEHYNASAVLALFKDHQREAEALPAVSPEEPS